MTVPDNLGILTDKEGAGLPGCRILVDGEQTDRPFTVLNFVQRYLDAIPKKARVCFQTKDGKISKIWEDKPAAGTSEKCTSPDKPTSATAQKDLDITLSGKLDKIDPATRTFTIKDVQDAAHPFNWPAVLDVVMKKWQPGYYLTVKFNPDTYDVNNVSYWQEGKEEWAKTHKGGAGGRSFVPRNEKIIVCQTVYKAHVENIRYALPVIDLKSDEDVAEYARQYNALMDIAMARTLKDVPELCKAGWVA
jgi:hypothetical protein